MLPTNELKSYEQFSMLYSVDYWEDGLMPNLNELSWVDAKGYFRSSDMALVPVGSNEQHGPQNPLGTDHLIALKLAEEASKRTGVLHLPVVPFGVSSHHRQFWGTVYVRPRVFKAYMRDICLSLKPYGVQKIVVVNGHGGNTPSLRELARELRQHGMFLSVFIWWAASKKGLPNLFSVKERRHASAEETSMNLALCPDLVEVAKAVDERVRTLFPKASRGIFLSLDTVDYSNSGVLGISTTASVEKGKQVFKTAVVELVKHIEALKQKKIEELLPRPLR